MNDSYPEKCIQALPAEKQPAARAAFRDIAEGGGDSVFAKVLVTLEGTAAYAATIPLDLTVRGEKLLREFDTRADRLAKNQTETEARREERLHQLISEQIPQLAKSLALDKMVERVAAQTAEIGRIERSVSRLRRARVGGLLLLMFLGGLIGAGALGGVFWNDYHSAQRAEHFITRLDEAGISLAIHRTEKGDQLVIEGPAVLSGTSWKKNGNGAVIGATLLFPTGGGQ